jgi:hypothetical protein
VLWLGVLYLVKTQMSFLSALPFLALQVVGLAI